MRRPLLLVVGLLALVGVGLVVYELTVAEDLGDRAEAVVDDPEPFLGERVTIAGEVEKFYPDGFTLGETTWGDELLVVPAEGTSVPRVITLREARPRVEITGTVYRNEGAEALPGPLFEVFEGKPYVRASRIEVAGEE